MEAVCGNRQDARRALAKVTSFAVDGPALRRLMVAAALAGDVAKTEALVQEFRKRVPQALPLYVPSAEALLDIYRGNAARAIERLQETVPYELAYHAELLPIYVRGLAYLSQKDGTAAAAEFKKVLDHRGAAAVSIYYPLSRLQQARAFALAGDTTRSRASYEAFLTAWKDADSDVPVLLEARREMDGLTRTGQ